ncbi:MAG: glycosyltransferase family 4 protein [Candidatus Levybacteria bacterium]|nr:glycosyltransferase family 4 protein [Candidatus Levybacteria bacterium]
MKILVVSSYLPYPLHNGGHIRLYNLLKEISKNHEITLVCEKRDYQTEKDVQEMEKICKKVITVRRRKQWAVGNILKTGFSLNPFLIVGHTNKDMKDAILELLSKEKFDLIHVETFYVMQNLPKTQIPIVLAEHNIEHMVYKKFADRKFLLRFPFYLDVLKMKRIEKSFWKKAAKLIAVSEEEKKLMNREDAAIVPNGVDTTKFQPKADCPLDDKVKNERKILFIGDFKWMQNKDTIEWILKEIWPSFIKISEGKPEAKLWIVGKNIPSSIKKLSDGDGSVIFDEDNKQETSEIFKKADLLLAPIRVGGGTSYKILEAMASGVPVITTQLGAEGINAKKNEDILVSDNAEEIAKMVNDILDDEKFYSKISQNARKIVEDKYDWKIIVKKLEGVYQSAIR